MAIEFDNPQTPEQIALSAIKAAVQNCINNVQFSYGRLQGMLSQNPQGLSLQQVLDLIGGNDTPGLTADDVLTFFNALGSALTGVGVTIPDLTNGQVTKTGNGGTVSVSLTADPAPAITPPVSR